MTVAAVVLWKLIQVVVLIAVNSILLSPLAETLAPRMSASPSAEPIWRNMTWAVSLLQVSWYDLLTSVGTPRRQ